VWSVVSAIVLVEYAQYESSIESIESLILSSLEWQYTSSVRSLLYPSNCNVHSPEIVYWPFKVSILCIFVHYTV